MTMQMKTAACAKCGATNIGPQARCLLCQAALPVEETAPLPAAKKAQAPRRVSTSQAPKKQTAAKAPPERAAAKPRQAGPRFCTQCGTPLKAGQRFCTGCGERI